MTTRVEDDLVTTEEAMLLLSIASRDTLLRLVREGSLPRVELGARLIRYRRADIHDLIQGSTRRSERAENITDGVGDGDNTG
jgi:excisionase family DNA binding protein